MPVDLPGSTSSAHPSQLEAKNLVSGRCRFDLVQRFCIQGLAHVPTANAVAAVQADLVRLLFNMLRVASVDLYMVCAVWDETSCLRRRATSRGSRQASRTTPTQAHRSRPWREASLTLHRTTSCNCSTISLPGEQQARHRATGTALAA